MKTIYSIGIALALGAVSGWGLGSGLRPDRNPPEAARVAQDDEPSETEEVVVAPASSSCPDEAGIMADISRMKKELDAREIALRVGEAELASVEGKPLDWPTDLPAVFKEEGAREEFSKMVAKVPDARLVDIDCGEYPCLAHLDITNVVGKSETWGKVVETSPYSNGDRFNLVIQSTDEFWVILALTPNEVDDENASRRIKARAMELQMASMQARP